MNLPPRRTPVQPHPHCFLESGIPAEHREESDWQRFEEQADADLIWSPDLQPQNRLAIEESLQLENRGVIPQIGANVHNRKEKPRQEELWRRQTIHKNTVAAKIRTVGMNEEAATLENCHSYYTVAQCGDCGAVRKFPNRCDLFYCPECQSRLQADRVKQIEWWIKLIKQPKHVVLTVKNTQDLTPEHIDRFRDWFTKLRRRKFASNWDGGFYRLEITNEGKGWHLHLHALINARWIDQTELALIWDNITGHQGRIVKVLDCREGSYLSEVTKYVVKGSQLAAWSPAQIQTFIRAFDGKRTFGVFGSLFGQRTEFAEFIATLKSAKPRCECGSCAINYYSEVDWTIREMQLVPSGKPAPPRPEFTQREFVCESQLPPR